MFNPQQVFQLASQLDICLANKPDTPPDIDASPEQIEQFSDALNQYTKSFMPQGAPSLTLSQLQAEMIRDMLAPNWSMQSIKIAAFEALAHLPMYAKQFGTEQSYREINSAREAVAHMNYILSALTMVQPAVETKEFIQFLRDPDTKVVAPLYNHLMALQYAEKLTRTWATIPVFAEGDPN